MTAFALCFIVRRLCSSEVTIESGSCSLLVRREEESTDAQSENAEQIPADEGEFQAKKLEFVTVH